MQTATSILLGCELWNTSGVLAWTKVVQHRAPLLPVGFAALLISIFWLGYSDWPTLGWRGRGHGVGQSLALPLGKEPVCLPKKWWAGVKAWPVASAKLLVWALAFYTAFLPPFTNLHLVSGTVGAKNQKASKRLTRSGISHMQRSDFLVWNMLSLLVLHFGF